MRRLRAAAAAALLSLLPALAIAAQDVAAAGQAFKRVALVVGANSGGAGRAKLKYAASDARSFASVLTELGGVRTEDLTLLIDPTLSEFRGAADRLKESAEKAAASGLRCEMVLFYSGHSDESGLLLGKERLPYDVLRSDIDKVPAAVRVAILDSCFSGSLTRTKGGAARPAFLFDASTDMKGYMYITSSSENEAAQESDRIGASFFTHYLISALRGAADTGGKGRVTLNDAYAFAFRETLASTENTQYGPQHPAYEISLTGSGDLVFTDLRSSSAGLALAEDLAGRFYVRDGRGALAVELEKPFGKRMEIGLPPGAYALSYMDRDQRYEARTSVAAGERKAIYAGDFKRAATAAAVARGAESPAAPELPPEAAPGEIEPDYAIEASAAIAAPAPDAAVPEGSGAPAKSAAAFPVSFSLLPAADFSKGIFSSEEDKVVGVNALFGMTRNLSGIEISTIFNSASGRVSGVQLSLIGNAVKERLAGLQLSSLANIGLAGGGGVQIASLLSLSAGDFSGFQMAASNIATGRLVGGQSGLVNFAKTIGGSQVGLVNVVEEGVGAQVGLVNACYEIRGVQIGLVNVADRVDGVAIGLISIEKGGIVDAEAWWSSDSNANAAFLVGTRYTYTIASFGWNTDSSDAPISLGVGLGGRVPLGGNYIGADLSWRFVDVGSESFHSLPRFRVVAGLRAKGPGMILGCAVDAYLPGLSRDGTDNLVSKLKLEPLLVVGIHL